MRPVNIEFCPARSRPGSGNRGVGFPVKAHHGILTRHINGGEIGGDVVDTGDLYGVIARIVKRVVIDHNIL